MWHHGRAAVAGASVALAIFSPPIEAQYCPAEWSVDRGALFDHSNAPLTEVADLVVDRRGRVAVGDEKTNTIFLFWSGRLSGTLGRTGDGPGEFRHPDNMLTLADSLFVTDTRLQRLTVFAPDGRVARTIRLGQSYAPFFLGETYPFGDRLLMLPNVAAPAVTQRVGFHVPLLLLSSSGAILDTIGEPLLRRHGVGMLTLPDGEAFFPLPAPEADFADVDPAGDGVVIARGEIQDGKRVIRLMKVSSTGETIFSRSVSMPAKDIPEAYLDSAYDAVLTRYAKRFGSLRQVSSALDDTWWVSEVMWPVHGLVVDNDSRIWVRKDLLDNAWLVFNPSGQPTGCVELPGNVRLYAAQGDLLWGIHIDLNDVQSVVQYRMNN